jgi:DNA-binding response OmpR family regulator
LLQAEEYDVRQAVDTDAVLADVEREPPELLILDVHMPGEGGIAALKRIRSNPALSEMRVLLLSGSVDLGSDHAAELGANAQLPKPCPIDELNSTVKRLLAG